MTNIPEGIFTRVLAHFTLPRLSEFTCSFGLGWSDESQEELPHHLSLFANITCLRLDASELDGDLLISILDIFGMLSELVLVRPSFVDYRFFDTIRVRNVLPRLRRLSLVDMISSAFDPCKHESESCPKGGGQMFTSLSQFVASRNPNRSIPIIPISDSPTSHPPISRSPVAELEYLALSVESVYGKLLPGILSTFALINGMTDQEVALCSQMVSQLEELLGLGFGGTNIKIDAEPTQKVSLYLSPYVIWY